MKSLARVAGLFVLALVGFVSGCSSAPRTTASRQPAQEFEVVESSTQRPLTAEEMAEVRATVAAYLDREGATEGGDYYLKVYLKPEDVDADSEWVVVRFTRYTDQRVSVVASYPYDNYLDSPYYAYDLYPLGYGCVTRISFQYYVDPFYHNHYYYPYYGRGGHKGGDHKDKHDTAHHRDGDKPARPGDAQSGDGKGRPHRPGGRYTGYRPVSPQIQEDNPRSRYNRYNPDATAHRRNPDATNADGRPARRDNPAGDGRHRRPRNSDASGLVNNANNSTPNPTPGTGAPLPVPPPQPLRPAVNPTASNPPSGNPPPQWRHRNPNSNPVPNGGSNNNLNRAPRTADRVAPATPRPQQVARPAPSTYRPAPSTVRSSPPQPSPQRTYTPPSPSPSRSAPSGGGSSERSSTTNSRDVLR
jgi:hypothetical protein